MFLAWTHTTCGTGNPVAYVDRCEGCGVRPTAITEVVQFETPKRPLPPIDPASLGRITDITYMTRREEAIEASGLTTAERRAS